MNVGTRQTLCTLCLKVKLCADVRDDTPIRGDRSVLAICEDCLEALLKRVQIAGAQPKESIADPG